MVDSTTFLPLCRGLAYNLLVPEGGGTRATAATAGQAGGPLARRLEGGPLPTSTRAESGLASADAAIVDENR